jgi:hypothetical protein
MQEPWLEKYVTQNQQRRESAKNPIESKLYKEANNKCHGALIISPNKPRLSAVVNNFKESEAFHELNSNPLKKKNPLLILNQ